MQTSAMSLETRRRRRRQLRCAIGNGGEQLGRVHGKIMVATLGGAIGQFRFRTTLIALCGLVLNFHASTNFKPASCFALKVTVAIPELVKLNDAFWLNCTHNSNIQNNNNINSNIRAPSLNNHAPSHQNNHSSLARASSDGNYQQIYSIKWYKDEEEFYRFLPGGEPRVSYYETKGVQPDKAKSFEGNVFLTKADLNSEGTYRCEILSEGPVFETVRKSKHLKVFALPVRGPKIEILDSNGKAKNPRAQEINYTPGEKIQLRCNSVPSKPAARLRWYLNDREIPMPGSYLTDRQGRKLNNEQALGYNVNVTAIEHRIHYQSIISSHSMLSLLPRDDIVISQISFKCVASIRQEVAIPSKQLILLMPHQQHSINRARVARSNRAELVGTPIEPEMESRGNSASITKQRHRAQYNTTPRLPPMASMLQMAPRRASTISDSELIGSLAEDSDNRMMYIYEDSDATLGPSIIDSPETLASYLNDTGRESLADSLGPSDQGNYALEFNRNDNLEYIQQLRERLWRQRSFPGSAGGGGGGPGVHKRIHGHHTLLKSPYYLDENDALRPVINWPPLDSGKLIVLPPSHSIVAIPTPTQQPNANTGDQPGKHRLFFVMPPRNELISNYLSKYGDENVPRDTSRMILDRLIENLNCTCSETNLDTRLKWIVNDRDLIDQDVFHYPTRVSPDHRQTWSTIGLFPPPSSPSKSKPNSLASILAQYHKLAEAQARTAHGQAAALRSGLGSGGGGLQVPVGNEQLRFMCQAQHHMLLYSSSETITFDFSPSSLNEMKGNTIDNTFASSSSNVIQASSGWSNSIISTGSHTLLTAIPVLSSIYIVLLTRT